MIKILAFAGSLREKSYNKAALRFAKSLETENLEIEIFDLKDIPLINEDYEPNKIPIAVLELIEKAKNANGFLIACPEYNHQMTGILKNVMDWLSREYAKDSIINKPLAILGCSIGSWGTVRSQIQLLQLATILDMRAYGSLRVAIPNSEDKFDEDGNLVDEKTKERIKKLVNGLVNKI